MPAASSPPTHFVFVRMWFFREMGLFIIGALLIGCLLTAPQGKFEPETAAAGCARLDSDPSMHAFHGFRRQGQTHPDSRIATARMKTFEHPKGFMTPLGWDANAIVVNRTTDTFNRMFSTVQMLESYGHDGRQPGRDKVQCIAQKLKENQ